MGREQRKTMGHGWVPLCMLALGGCGNAAPDGPACAVTVFTTRISSAPETRVDLLLVVDDSASMGLQQQLLRADLTRALQAAALDRHYALDLHVAVVSSDMGVSATDSLSEGCGAFGRDGQMLREHIGGDPACTGVALDEPYVSYREGDDLEATIDRIACLAHTGAGGCGFEQPLEAALKALARSDSTVRFERTRGGTLISDTGGHGDGANAGFLRESSTLVISVITDEDDCSSADVDLYTPRGASPPYPALEPPSADPIAHCAAYRDAQSSVRRYVDGFLALRQSAAQLVFVTASGVSPAALQRHSVGLSQDGTELLQTDFAALLADADMAERWEDTGVALVPTCTRPEPTAPDDPAAASPAYPSRRQAAERRAGSAVVWRMGDGELHLRDRRRERS